jgi:cobalt/nickel transport system permease protein
MAKPVMHPRLSEDGFASQPTPLHRLPAAVKVSAAILLILTVVVLPQAIPKVTVPLLTGVAILLTAVLLASRQPLLPFLHRMLLLEPFVLGVAVLSIFQPGGWRVMILVVIKCTLCLATTVLLASTTPASELIRLLKRIHAPALLVTTLMLMYRYLFVLAEESQRMSRARSSRTFTHRRWPRWRAIASVVSQLFIRASDRAERVYSAMCARGWR